MHRVIPILTVIVIASVSLFGQTAKCPKLTIIGPAGISNPGDAIIFRLETEWKMPPPASLTSGSERRRNCNGAIH
jgi:hypothetical protein